MTIKQRWTMAAAILGSSIVFLDGTIVNIALQKIGATLSHSIVGVLEGQTYITSGYLAILAALLILAGALADYYGRRRIFVIGLVGFGATSTLCGLAPNLELLALFRLLQGASGALLVPCSLSIITATFEGEQRARAFGLWAAATSATTLFGPVVGGFLVDNLTWRLAFIVNVPLVVIALYATIAHMDESRDDSATGEFDWLGAIVVGLAVGGLSFGAIRGQQEQWRDPIAFVSLGIGLVCLVAFPILMVRSRHPLVPLGLFRNRPFATINLSTFLIYGALYLVLSFQNIFLQGTLGYTAQAASVIGLPTGLLLTFLSAKVGSVAGRIGARPFLVVGPLLMATGLAWMVRIPASSVPWQASVDNLGSFVPPVSTLIDVMPFVVVFGIGISLVVAPLTTTLMGSVPVRNSGLASAINNSISRVGQPILSAVIFIVISATFYATLAGAVPGLDVNDPSFRSAVAPLNQPANGTSAAVAEAARNASTDAYHLAMAVAAALLVAGAAVNYVGLRTRETAPGKAPADQTPEQPAARTEEPVGPAGG